MVTVTITGEIRADNTPDSDVIEFTPVFLTDKEPCEGWVTASGEIVTKTTVTATLDEHGVGSVSLWPTDDLSPAIVYRVRSRNSRFRMFYASLPASPATTTLITMMASQVPLTAAELSALEIHAANASHLPLQVGADGSFVKVVDGAPAYVAVAPGMGDMTAAVYDTNEDGKVNAADAADSVPWSGVTDKPTTFPPETHSHNYAAALGIDDNYVTDAEKAALHGHSNKSALDKISEGSNLPLWNGGAWPGGSGGGVSDHTLLTNIGTTSHSAIDTALSRLASTSGTNTGDQDLSGYSTTSHNHSGTYDPAGSASTVAGNLSTHAALTTTAHGGLVASNDSRLSDSRTPTAHKTSHATGGSDALTASDIGAAASGHDHSGVYQPADAQLTSLASLTYASNAAKVVKVNATEDGFELAADSGIALSDSSPVMDGTAAAGTATTAARGDHSHPSDTSKLSLTGGTITGAIVGGMGSGATGPKLIIKPDTDSVKAVQVTKSSTATYPWVLNIDTINNRVGISSSQYVQSPTATLEVSSVGVSGGVQYPIRVRTDNSNGFVGLDMSIAGNFTAGAIYAGNTESSSKLFFLTNGATNSLGVRAVIDGVGNLGIGTTVPSEKLSILDTGNVSIGNLAKVAATTNSIIGKHGTAGTAISGGSILTPVTDGWAVTTESGTTTTVGNGIVSAKFRITPEGGYAVKMIAGETLNAGEVVYIPQAGTGNDGEVRKAPTSNDMPVGVVYASASATADVWVVTSGKVAVLPETGVTAARGNVIYVSANEAGRVNQATTPPVNDHWREIGHFTATGSGNGAATLAIIHFN